MLVMLFSSSILLGWYIPMLLAIYTLRKTWGFSERHYSLKDFSCFFGFWSWLKDRISLSERLGFFWVFFHFFSFWKTSNWFRKTCCFLFWKTFFIRKTWMLKKDMRFLQKDMNFYFQKDLVVVIFFRKTCNFFFRKTCNFLQKDL